MQSFSPAAWSHLPGFHGQSGPAPTSWATIKSGDALFLTQTDNRISPSELTEIVGECVRDQVSVRMEPATAYAMPRQPICSEMAQTSATSRVFQGICASRALKYTRM